MKAIEMEERILSEVEYFLGNKCTIRQCANHFKVSKSTTHKDLVERLPKISLMKYEKIREILDHNWEEKYIRGGLATQARYKNI
jgi:putative DeoR family transcriptional regulator (stage III sporulation protein D)